MEVEAPMGREKANEAELEIPEASADTGFIQRLPQFIQRVRLTGEEENRDLPSGEAEAAIPTLPQSITPLLRGHAPASCVWNPRVFADDARGWQCPFVLCR